MKTPTGCKFLSQAGLGNTDRKYGATYDRAYFRVAQEFHKVDQFLLRNASGVSPSGMIEIVCLTFRSTCAAGTSWYLPSASRIVT